MPIKDLQKRARELGRIRTGHKNAERGFPQKLAKFRLTTPSRRLIEKVAELYGGEPREWTPQGGAQQWEVYTDTDRLPIIVPPQPVSQWYETWTAGGCTHRCDGETDYITGEACDGTSREHQESKPTTRLNVILRDVEGVGFWRLESHGWNSAVELPEAAEFLAQAGGYIDGFLCLEERVTKREVADGHGGTKVQTNRFMVPTIEVAVTPAQLLAGQGRIIPALEGGPVPQGVGATHALNASQGQQEPAQARRLLPTADDIAAAADKTTLMAMWQELEDAHAHTPETDKAGEKRMAELDRPPVAPPASQENGDGTWDAEVVEDGQPEHADATDADMAWNRVLFVAGMLEPPMSTVQVTEDFERAKGVHPSKATAAQLMAYATELEGAAS